EGDQPGQGHRRVQDAHAPRRRAVGALFPRRQRRDARGGGEVHGRRRRRQSLPRQDQPPEGRPQRGRGRGPHRVPEVAERKHEDPGAEASLTESESRIPNPESGSREPGAGSRTESPPPVPLGGKRGTLRECCVLGAIVGDIVGSIYEFNNHRSKDFPLWGPRCSFTDDSVLTVALADAILTGGDYADAMRRNGAAMRISPAGWAYATLEETLTRAREFTAVTHDHPEGLKGAEATAGAIWMGRQGASKSDIKAWVLRHTGYDLSRTCGEIRPTYEFNETCQRTVP